MAYSSSISSIQQKYEVFLSFRGEDTRNGFVSHLCEALQRSKINFFIDNELNRGEKISQALLTAIEESKISIIVFSENYASSSWCLDELSKIIECKNTNGQVVLPIFYHVDPDVVRRQKRKYEEAFSKHEERFSDSIDKVDKWRNALVEVAGLSGWHLKEDIPEADFIDDIIKFIWVNLYREFSSDFKGLVGMESRLEELKSLLDGMKSDGVRIIGIWGMPGVGKTKSAEVLFKHISSQFDASCFLADVRQKSMLQGLQCARNELFSKLLKPDVKIDTPSLEGTPEADPLGRRKVLIVLDDVINSQQVEYLIGDGSCFGPKSIIVITSRDKGALSAIAGDKIYMVEKLPFDQALELFCQNASRGGCDIPVKEDPNLIGVVRYADGIPLALKILGDFLCGKSEAVWKAAVRSLNSEIKKELRISYDELENNERNIFLDVACFFEGEDRNHVTSILEGCDFSAETGMIVLINKSLISILNNNLQMNNLIQEMGREIVRQESKHPGCRSRLWTYDDIEYILTTDKGTKTVEGIFLNMSEIEEPMCINGEAFLQMDCLRLLKIYSPHSQEDYIVNLPVGFQIHSNKLAYLHWHCCPSESWPLKFCPKNLVELHMHYSHVIRLWEGIQKLSYLKWIDLSYSKCLKEIPVLSKTRNLERINLVGCTSLLEIPSIAPPLDSLPKLQAVYLSGCSNIKNFPLLSWNVEELHLDGTAIEELPSEIQHFSSLVKLNMKNCRMLKDLPSIHCKLRSLEFLDLSGCSSLMKFPEISWNLKELLLNETAIEELPSSIKFLDNLVSLELKNCMRIKYLPSSIYKLKLLECLEFSGCPNLTNFVEIPGSVKKFYFEGTAREEHALSNLVSQQTRQC